LVKKKQKNNGGAGADGCCEMIIVHCHHVFS